jgi:tripartite-type tricarboxylate transporter receptor subunit TctC
MFRLTALLLGALLAQLCWAQASQPYPSKPVRIVVPLAAGGTGDTLARLLGEELSKTLPGSVIVENRPGSGGVIGTEAVARSAPDGYTLLLTSPSHVLNTALRPKLSYDPLKDFTAIAQVADTHQVLLANPALKVATVGELVALAKAKPATITYGSAGNGSATHLNAELFKSLAGIDLVHVPYKGSTQARTDLLSGQIQLAVDGLLPTLPYVKAGKLRALAVTNAKRAAVAPDIPTMAEAGVAGYKSDTWYALLAPAGLPDAVSAKLQSATQAAIRSAALREKFLQQGAEPVSGSSRELAELLRQDLARWRKVVVDTGVQVD